MGFEVGNQWWKNRSKHGTDAIFTDPKVLYNAISEYFETTNERRDWDGQNWVGKDGEEVVVKKQVPFSLKGLCIFLGVSSHYFSEFKKSKMFLSDPDFLEVYTWAMDVIETQQVDGGLLGYFNASLTARLNGLSDKQDMTLNATVTQLSNEPKTRKECEDMLRKLTE